MEISEKERQHLKAIGEKLRKKRKELGLTQTALYIQTGVPVKRIGEIEGGLHNPSHAMIYRLATSLGMTMEELTSEDSCPSKCPKEEEKELMDMLDKLSIEKQKKIITYLELRIELKGKS